MSTMKAMLLTAPGRIEPGTWQTPDVKPGHALVRLRHTGVCGSDLHYFEHGRIGKFVVEYPFILGHEAAGEVVALGEGAGVNRAQQVRLNYGAGPLAASVTYAEISAPRDTGFTRPGMTIIPG